ncbi:MAG: prolyl oligopeptidase family serine peptidase [Chthoniobacterales bacterium]
MIRVISLLAFSCSVGLSEAPRYPDAKKEGGVDDYHGTKVADPYRWLEDPDSPETAAWVKAENQLTGAYLGKLPDKDYFKQELTKIWNFERYTPPSWEGHRYIFRKNSGLQNQSVIYTARNLNDNPTVVLDPNQLSADGTVAVTSIDVSDDGTLLAYGEAANGSDWTEIRVRDIETGRNLPEVVKWIKFSGPSWSKDSKGFFYSRYPEPDPTKNQTFAQLRNQKVYYHRLGEPVDKDELIYERPEEPEWGLDATVSKSGRYAIFMISKGTDPKNQLYVKDLGDPLKPTLHAPLTPLVASFEASYTPLAVLGDQLFVRTDKDAPLYKIVEIDLTKPDRANWKVVVSESKDLLEEAAVVGGKLVLNYLVDAKSQLKVADLDGKVTSEIPLPTLGSVSGLSGDQDRPELFYAFTSFLYPPTIYRYEVDTGKNEVFKQPELGFSPEGYETEQIFYESKDGTRVPMFIVRRKDLKLDSKNPVYLTGYGGFNISYKPGFSIPHLAWVKKGGVFAVPNLRGGGEYGRAWHEAGTKERKQNVFDDFIAAAETLINRGYTSASKIAIAGESNGGLLIGAAVTQRPELFGAAVPRVGVLDMLRYDKFTIGWAWAPDYGTANDPEAFKYLFKYSPLHNIKRGTCYPPMLITTADHDDRVVPGHSFKFAATLQAAQGCDNPVLIRVDTKAGHGGGKPITKVIDEESDILAFMWDNVTKDLAASAGGAKRAVGANSAD